MDGDANTDSDKYLYTDNNSNGKHNTDGNDNAYADSYPVCFADLYFYAYITPVKDNTDHDINALPVFSKCNE